MKTDLHTTVMEIIDAYFDGVHTVMPGIVKDFNATKKTATVQPAVKMKTDEGQFIPLPYLHNVPVIFPGSVDAVIQFPLKDGDKCLLMFSEVSLEAWARQGGGTVDDGGDPRFYSLMDAFCIPGCFAPSSPGKVGTGNGMEIIYKNTKVWLKDDGTVEAVGLANGDFKITPAGIMNLSGSSEQVAMWTALNTAFQGLLTIMNAAVVGSPGAKVFATPLTLDLSSAKSTKVLLGG